jgi:hypothetical protein
MIHTQHAQRKYSATALSRLLFQQPHRLRCHALAARGRHQTNPHIRGARFNSRQLHKPTRPLGIDDPKRTSRIIDSSSNPRPNFRNGIRSRLDHQLPLNRPIIPQGRQHGKI